MSKRWLSPKANAVSFVDEHRDLPKAMPLLSNPGGDPWPLGCLSGTQIGRKKRKNRRAEKCWKILWILRVDFVVWFCSSFGCVHLLFLVVVETEDWRRTQEVHRANQGADRAAPSSFSVLCVPYTSSALVWDETQKTWHPQSVVRTKSVEIRFLSQWSCHLLACGTLKSQCWSQDPRSITLLAVPIAKVYAERLDSEKIPELPEAPRAMQCIWSATLKISKHI